MTQPRYPRKFVPKPGIVATIYYYSQSAPDSKPIPHFANGTTGVSAHSVDEILALGYVEVFDHLPAEQIRYGAREPDGTRTVIVGDSDWQPFDGRFRKGMEYRSRDWELFAYRDSCGHKPDFRHRCECKHGPMWYSDNGTATNGYTNFDITHQRPVRAPQPAPQVETEPATNTPTVEQEPFDFNSAAMPGLNTSATQPAADMDGVERLEVWPTPGEPWLHHIQRRANGKVIARLENYDGEVVRAADHERTVAELRAEVEYWKNAKLEGAWWLTEKTAEAENIRLRIAIAALGDDGVSHVSPVESLEAVCASATARAEAAEAERDAIRVQWQSLSDEREEERAALRRRGIRFVKVGGILEAIILIDEPKAYTPTKPGELDRLLHEAHAESLTPATVNDAAKIEAFTHTEWKRGTKDGCGGELRPHLIELVRKSDYDALQGRCEALTKECDEWKAEAERCGQFELRQVEEREAIKRAVGFEENVPSLPEWCAKIARNLASEEAACSQLIDERDGAQDAADHLASNILGEPIDWSFHAEKWNEAREAALALRTQLAEANKRCDELTEHERQTHERLGAILGTDDSLEECAKRLKAEVERLKESFDAVWSVCVECGMKEEKMSAEDAAESGCDEGDVYACQYGFIRNLHRRAEAAEAEGAEYRKLALKWERKCAALVAALEDYNHAVELVVYRDSIDQARAALADAKEAT